MKAFVYLLNITTHLLKIIYSYFMLALKHVYTVDVKNVAFRSYHFEPKDTLGTIIALIN